MSQCYRGVEQAEMPIYLGIGPKGSRSCSNECAGLKQPFGSVHYSEQKVINRVRRHTFLEWNKLQVDL